MNDIESIIVLNALFNPAKVYELIRHFSSVESVLDASEKELRNNTRLDPDQIGKLLNWEKSFHLEKEIKRIEKSETKVVPFWSEDYPKILSEIPSAPLLLYIRGAFMPSHEGGVGMVGTRAASLYGRRITKKFAQEFAYQGISVISGFARGIDCAAHEGAVQTNSGLTFAVLGCRFDQQSLQYLSFPRLTAPRFFFLILLTRNHYYCQLIAYPEG